VVEQIQMYCHVIDCDYRRGLDWYFDLLDPYRSVNTTKVLSLIHTLYNSLSQTAVYSLVAAR
jgi:hypothetical protein